jgi:hypothetical protein
MFRKERGKGAACLFILLKEKFSLPEHIMKYHLEMLTIAAAKQWRHHLEGSRYPVIVSSDHANPHDSTDVRRDGRKSLTRSNFIIEHHPGKKFPQIRLVVSLIYV